MTILGRWELSRWELSRWELSRWQMESKLKSGLLAWGIAASLLVQLGAELRFVQPAWAQLNPSLSEAEAQSSELGRPATEAAEDPTAASATAPETETQRAIASQLEAQLMQLTQAGQYQKAIPLAQQVLDLHRQFLDESDVRRVKSLNRLAALYLRQGQFEAAEPLYLEAFNTSQKILGSSDPDLGISMTNLAFVYSAQGKFDAAEQLYQQALSLAETTLKPDHPDIAASKSNLASLYANQGRYSEAEALVKQSLASIEKRLGQNHLFTAAYANNLANLYIAQGKYQPAEPLLKRSLEIRRLSSHQNQAQIATALNNLAHLYYVQGRYPAAEPLFEEAIALGQQALGGSHFLVSDAINNLGLAHVSQENYGKAEAQFNQALQLRQEAFGKEHYKVAESLGNLALVHAFQGNYKTAERVLKQSHEIGQKSWGSDHPFVANSLNSLAILHLAQAKYRTAAPLFQQALALKTRILGSEHPLVADGLTNLALAQLKMGDLELGTRYLRQGLDLEELHLKTNIVAGAEEQKRDYIQRLKRTTDLAVSLNLETLAHSSEATELALLTLLRRKGRILEALNNSTNRDTAQLPQGPNESQSLLAQYIANQTQLANLTYGLPSNRHSKQHPIQIQQLRNQANALQAQLSELSAEFRQQTESVTMQAVQQALPAKATLIEIARYQPLPQPARPDKAGWDEPRYGVYILTAEGAPVGIDLGPAAPIDQLAANFRQALQRQDPNIKHMARQLDAMLMQPVRQQLSRGAKQLLISPDSQLNLVPFAALVDENNQYLLESYDISYLASGRDLLRISNPKLQYQPQQGPLLVANPDYANPGTPAVSASFSKSNLSLRQSEASFRVSPPQASLATRNRATTSVLAPVADASSTESYSVNRRSNDFSSSIHFSPLPGTAAEAELIGRQLPEATVLTGSDATENVIKTAQAPSILHIATHGFFLRDLPSGMPNHSLNFNGVRAGLTVVQGHGKVALAPYFSQQTENPLLRSGLALAGFNPRSSGSEDGVLTALEASNLNLRGTQLVVLSACDTGLGDIANGEGVYGMRRAFAMAGAESQLISLWQVDDFGTKDLMVDYYENLVAGEGRAAALHNTQRSMLRGRYSHPYYWASFIASGDWRSLNSEARSQRNQRSLSLNSLSLNSLSLDSLNFGNPRPIALDL